MLFVSAYLILTLQQIPFHHSPEFKGFMKFYKDYPKKPFSFLVNDANLTYTTHYDLGRSYYKMTISMKTINQQQN